MTKLQKKCRLLFRELARLTVGVALVTIGLPTPAAVFDRQGKKLPEHNLDPDSVNWQMLDSSQGKAYTGIGRIRIRDFSSCTGFLLRTNSPEFIQSQAPAYIVTNGHCIDLIDNLLPPQEIVVDRRLRSLGRSGSMLTYTPHYFARADRLRRSYAVQRVLYATMKNTDLALLELNVTQGDLVRDGVKPIAISPSPAVVGQAIEVVGVPGEVLPGHRQFLHRSTCLLGPTVAVKEGSYFWAQALRNRCSLVGGMSGSPMLASGVAIGLINTGGGYDREQNLCALNNPCEISSQGKAQHTVYENYGQPLQQMVGCFTPQGVFNLYQFGCGLERPLVTGR